jgi:hypothetical protein
VQSRAGNKARIVVIDKKGSSYPIVALVENERGEEVARIYTAEGQWHESQTDRLDLVNVPEKRVIEFWRNVYQNNNFRFDHPTKEQADRQAAWGRIACVHFRQEYVEGEGL